MRSRCVRCISLCLTPCLVQVRCLIHTGGEKGERGKEGAERNEEGKEREGGGKEEGASSHMENLSRSVLDEMLNFSS